MFPPFSPKNMVLALDARTFPDIFKLIKCGIEKLLRYIQRNAVELNVRSDGIVAGSANNWLSTMISVFVPETLSPVTFNGLQPNAGKESRECDWRKWIGSGLEDD